MAKTTQATQIRKAFKALSRNGKQAYSEDGRGRYMAWGPKSEFEAGLVKLAEMGFVMTEDRGVFSSVDYSVHVSLREEHVFVDVSHILFDK